MFKTNPTKSEASKPKYAKGTLLKNKLIRNMFYYIDEVELGPRSGEYIYGINYLEDNSHFTREYENDIILCFDIYYDPKQIWFKLND